MPPKAKDGAPLDAANFQFIFAVLKHDKSTIEPDWGRSREGMRDLVRSSTKFMGMIKKLGFQLDAGKISFINESTPALVATPEKANSSCRKLKTPATNKKRKIAVEDEEEVENQQDGDKVKMHTKVNRSEVSGANGDDDDDDDDEELA